MTDSSLEPIDAVDTPAEAIAAPDAHPTTKTAAPSMWRSRIARSRNYKRQLIEQWRVNIDMRRGKVYESDSDEDRIAITYDWSATKAKNAQLFSQVPQVRLKARHQKYKDALPTFARKLNSTLDQAGLGTAMNEVMPDTINAAGFGLLKVSFESLQEMRDLEEKGEPPTPTPTVPMAGASLQMSGGTPPPAPGALPPMAGMPPAAAGSGMPPAAPAQKVTPTPYTTAKRILIDRVSPSDGLWDLTFAGSNFNRSPWVGNSGRMHFSRALRAFAKSKDNPGGLTPEDKETVCGTGVKSSYDRLTNDEDRDRYVETEMVEYDEVFYWRYLFHDDETSFEAIQRMVFVRGKSEPVVNEPWKGQMRINEVTGKEDPEGTVIVGSCLFPLQFLTLTYLTDEAIPPSDTAMGRPQVEELMQGRTDMMLQRRHSRPMRWHNNNLISPEISTMLMRGTWQGSVPLNGDGTRALGELARANYPQENDMFDRIAKVELGETWSIGGSQGQGGGANTQIRTAAEANNAQANMNTRIGYERGRVISLVCNTAQVVAGLLCLYGDWDDEEKQALGDLSLLHLPGYYTYGVRVDASVLLDAEQRYGRLDRFWNATAKSGLVDEVPVLQEMASLIDVDEEYVRQPPAKAPEPINVSLRISGAEDLDNPVIVAMLIQSGQMPSMDKIREAQQAIIASKNLPPPPPPPGIGGQAGPAGPGGPGVPPPPVRPPQEDLHPEIDMAGRVNKRQQDGR